MKWLKAFFMCLGMFTAIPLPYRPWDDSLRPHMTACLPFAGLVSGGIWLLCAWLMRLIGFPAALSAAILVVIPWLVTGAIHLDGYMDTSDAVLSWRALEERLRILKDPHTGSFAVIAVCVVAILSFGAAQSLLDAGRALAPLMLIPVMSRCCSAFCVCTLKPLGHSEYAGQNGNLGAISGVACAVISLGISCIWGWQGITAVLAVAAGYALTMRKVYKVLGGFSGDLAGCALTIGECCGLIAMALV